MSHVLHYSSTYKPLAGYRLHQGHFLMHYRPRLVQVLLEQHIGLLLALERTLQVQLNLIRLMQLVVQLKQPQSIELYYRSSRKWS